MIYQGKQIVVVTKSDGTHRFLGSHYTLKVNHHGDTVAIFQNGEQHVWWSFPELESVTENQYLPLHL